jgi:signal transduction histidine kinase
MANLYFTVDSALLSELGEKLVESVHLALVELVKNSYDADAQNVIIKFIGDDSCIEEIQIVDDGIGMTHEEVREYWMRIATTNKTKKLYSTLYGRPKTGSKGIGRFCCRRLGLHLRLITTGKNKSKFEKTDVIFPWREKFVAGTDVTTIECAGEQVKKDNAKTGTTLIISDLSLNQIWNKRSYDYVKRKLAVLAANRGVKRKGYKKDPGFNIVIDAPQFEGRVVDLRDELLNAGWGTLTASINKEGNGVFKLKALKIGTKSFTTAEKFTGLKDVRIKIGIMVDVKEQMRNSKVLSLGSLKKILPEWGGVQIRYKGFRVGNYGDDDWLDIDKERGLRRTTPVKELYNFASTLRGVDPSRALLSMLSMRGYVGSVELGEKALGFEMKLNREGFIESDSFRQLKKFVRFAIHWSQIYREYFIRLKAKESTEIAREYLEDVLNKKITNEEVITSAVAHINREIKTVVDYLPAKEKREVQSILKKATDAIISYQKGNVEELRHLRLIASTSTLLLIFSHEVKSLMSALETHKNTLEIVKKKLKGKDREEIKELQKDLNETRDRFEDLLSLTSLISVNSKKANLKNLSLRERIIKSVNRFKLITDEYEIKIDYSEVPSTIIVHHILEAELFAIILNILSNSIKAVIAHNTKKSIKIIAKKQQGKNIITFADTGIGLSKDKYDEVFIPFIADPSNSLYSKLAKNLNPADKYIVGTGSGLGLSIVKDIIQLRGGSISFIPSNKNWSTILEVQLP